MSQLLNRVLNPLVCKNVLRHNIMVRWCTSTPYYPFLLIDHLLKFQDSPDGRIVRGDASEGEREVVIRDQKLVEEVRKSMNIEFLRKRQEICITKNNDGILPYMDYIYQEDLTSIRWTHTFFGLPPLPSGSQVQNIATSCSFDLNNEDWVVAAKFSGSQLRLYRRKDPRWINIETTYESISPSSSIMYSKKDQRFYVPTPGCKYLFSIDLNFKENDKPEFVEVRKKDHPMDDLYDLEVLSTKTQHMVESPSGEQFLISWYYTDDYEIHKTRKFMVYREDTQLSDKKTKYMSYTEDIGDVSIFLGRDEAFCLRASSSPGLKPNCVYFVGHNNGVYDITTQTCTLFLGLRSTQFPYWPHPLSLLPS